MIELTWVLVDKTRLLMILSSISVVDGGCCDDSRTRIGSRFGPLAILLLPRLLYATNIEKETKKT